MCLPAAAAAADTPAALRCRGERASCSASSNPGCADLMKLPVVVWCCLFVVWLWQEEGGSKQHTGGELARRQVGCGGS